VTKGKEKGRGLAALAPQEFALRLSFSYIEIATLAIRTELAIDVPILLLRSEPSVKRCNLPVDHRLLLCNK
jgi:hypothetical protein